MGTEYEKRTIIGNVLQNLKNIGISFEEDDGNGIY